MNWWTVGPSMSLPLVVRHYFCWTEEISNNQKVVSNHDFTKSCCMKCNNNPVLIKCYTWERYKSKLLNSLQLWNQNGNFRKLEFIADFRTSKDSCFAGPTLFLPVSGFGPAGYFEDCFSLSGTGYWQWHGAGQATGHYNLLQVCMY